MEGGKQEHKRGFWTVEEDRILMEYIRVHGKGRWNRVAKITGLKRCGKSCRLRWINYLSPSVKRGDFSEEEDDLIIRLHNLLGNRWSLIAGRVPGRTDNQVKNHWNTHLSKKLGIKKVKSKIGASSQTISIQVGESLKSPSLCESNSRVPSNSIGGPVGQEGIKDLASLHEPTMSMEGNESSFWSSNDDFMNSSSIMEFMDEFSFDFGWHCL